MLKWVCRDKDVKFVDKIPATDKGIVTALLRVAFPTITAERVAEIYAARKRAEKHDEQREAMANLAANVEKLGEVLNEDDYEEIKKTVIKHRENLEREARVSASRPSMVGVRTPDRGDDFTHAEASAYMPPTVKIKLTKDVTLHWRGEIEFPGRAEGNIFFARSWGGRTHHSQKDALVEVLREAWAWNKEIPFTHPCPFDFDVVFERP